MIIKGDCIEKLKELEASSVDALVTDPPAGISFMNKEWDHHKGGRLEWIAWMRDVMSEAMRVLKPGAHGLVWALPRTSHWTATALEDAGFEIRDCVYHFFGSGFPKSLDVSKAIDKGAGAKRKVIGRKHPTLSGKRVSKIMGDRPCLNDPNYDPGALTEPATPEAQQWEGFGTALKPAVECWWLVRKPISEKTVAMNVLKWGTGALNIDGCRIGVNAERVEIARPKLTGRFPSHLVFSHTEDCTEEMCSIECAIKQLDEQSLKGGMHSAGSERKNGINKTGKNLSMFAGDHAGNGVRFGDSGGASRFFYCAKASKSERNEGLQNRESKKVNDGRKAEIDNPFQRGETERLNTHPTVKSTKLMQYLIRLITPPNGVVLDPFMGSGSTGVAAKKEGLKFIGIEMNDEYFEIASKRIENAAQYLR